MQAMSDRDIRWKDCAAVADARGTFAIEGHFTAKLRITTGAGDPFTAGFCLSRLLGLGYGDRLWLGVATSGFYVRHAQRPSAADLVAWLRPWPVREALIHT
jgi:sugar/nucleoside kinase (ribokinase family)